MYSLFLSLRNHFPYKRKELVRSYAHLRIHSGAANSSCTARECPHRMHGLDLQSLFFS